MSTYSNIITLAQISDGSGKGIERIKVLYATSNNGIQPPSDKMVEYAIENGTLSSSDPINTFKIDNLGILYLIRQDDFRIGKVDKEQILKIDGEVWKDTPYNIEGKGFFWTKTITYYTDGEVIITYYASKIGQDGQGVKIISTSIQHVVSNNGTTPPGDAENWSENIPESMQGEYLWTRTIIAYSDGTSTKTYGVSYFGIDGKDSNTFYIETNNEEILRFKEQDGYSYSPEILTFKIYQLSKQGLENQLEISEDSYSLEVFSLNTPEEIKEDEEILRRGFVQQIEGMESQIVDINTVYFNLASYYNETNERENNQIFRFSFLLNGKVEAVKIIQMRNGVSEDMAKLNLHASGIDAAIQSKKMSFSADGLALYENNERVFWSDKGRLWLKGNLSAAGGTFSGVLEAASGTFTGEITANSGKIGGLTIAENALYSGSSSDGADLKISGDGKIYAQNITLGSGTIIENFIELGKDENKVYIYAPTEENDYTFLKSGHISLHNQGLLKIGDITLNGGDGTYGSEYVTSGTEDFGAYWKICGDGTANFRELTVDKITVQKSVMEIGKIQAVGSVMFFKDSWKVKAVDGQVIELELTLKDENGNYIVPLLEGDYLAKDGNDYYKIDKIDKTDENVKITFNRECAFSKGEVLTKIGKSEDYLITIQGDSNQNLPHSTPNSLTLSKVFVNENDLPGYSKKLVLGDLSNIENAAGIGLFAENVYLKGTLSTQVDNNSYAGINTLNGVSCTKFTDVDKSKIVFWAGASSNNETDIQKAPFQVTEKGSLYANQGLFEGSLITNSIIKGASIHTAKIYGEDTNGGKAALQIFDAENGIQFIKSEDSKEVQLGIAPTGLYSSWGLFIEIGEEIGYFGQRATYTNENSILFLRPNYIGFNDAADSLDPSWKIKHESNSGFDFINGENSIFEINKDLIKGTKKVNFEQNLTFGVNNSQGALDYQKTNEGYYNLYVR